MKKLFDFADRYLAESSWKDLALIKLCVFSVGLLAGTCIPRKSKGFTRIIAAAVYSGTLSVIMVKIVSLLQKPEA